MESGSFCESDIESVSHLTKRMSVRHVEKQLWTCLWQNQTFKADVCWRLKLQRSAKEPRAGRRDTAAVAVSCILYLCSVFLAVVPIYSQCLCFLWSSSNKFEDISIYIKQIKPIRLWNAFFLILFLQSLITSVFSSFSLLKCDFLNVGGANDRWLHAFNLAALHPVIIWVL